MKYKNKNYVKAPQKYYRDIHRRAAKAYDEFKKRVCEGQYTVKWYSKN